MSNEFRTTLRGEVYQKYANMVNRCFNPDHPRYLSYGGAGVTVASEWLGDSGFDNFYYSVS